MINENILRTAYFLFPLLAGNGLVWTARALASGRITRNWFIGIRLPATMKSDAAWLPATSGRSDPRMSAASA